MKLHRTVKLCSICKIVKPLEAFGKVSERGDGRSIYCRECWNAYVNSKRRECGAKPIPPFLERLWGNIQQCGHEETCVYCCWPWLKGLDQDGYGKIAVTVGGIHRTLRVTRVIYEVWHGVRIPDGLLACHYCDSPPCGNPLHLWIGSLNDNRQDCVRKGRQARGDTSGLHTMPEAFPRGESHYRAKVTEADVRLIRGWYAEGGITAQRLSEHYGVSKFAILCILNHKTWKHVA
jgi:hypothetical protein